MLIIALLPIQVTIEVGTATVNAGTDIGVCIGNSTQIGGSPAASGSKIPYTYAWSPTSTLTSATIPNPVASPVTATNYILSVTDGYGCVGKDTVVVRVNALPVANAGPDKPWCTTAIAIGGSPTAFWWKFSILLSVDTFDRIIQHNCCKSDYYSEEK